MADDERESGGKRPRSPSSARVEDLLKRAARVRRRNEVERPTPAQRAASPTTGERPAAGRADDRVRETTAVHVRETPELTDRVVLVLDGRHYVAPIGGHDPVKVAAALHRFVQRRAVRV